MEVPARRQNVDIIVCVHDAPDDVRRCLEAVLSRTLPPYDLIIVDDGSGPETKAYLEQFVVGQPATIIRKDSAAGYAGSANTGMKASKSEFVVLLHSDTIVPSRWLDRLMQCANSDDRIGMVGPLSNSAAWQSVPHVINAGGEWGENRLPSSWSIDDYANEMVRMSPKSYPRVGFLNGFCLLIKRKLIEDIGVLDEETFARCELEVDDYCLRATQREWQLAVADDCFVFHAEPISHARDRRAERDRLVEEALGNAHGQNRVGHNLAMTRSHPVLQYLRKRCESIDYESRIRRTATHRFEGKRVMVLLPTECAGAWENIVLREAARMREFGVDVWVARLEGHRTGPRHPRLGIPVLYLGALDELVGAAVEYDAVIATHYLAVLWMESLKDLVDGPVLAYYVQDYEADLLSEDTEDNNKAVASYSAIPGLRLFTKSTWALEILKNKLGVCSDIVGPSVDRDTHYPTFVVRDRNRIIQILAMVRPSAPRSAPEKTMRVLRRLSRHFGNRVAITISGVKPNNQQLASYNRAFPYYYLSERDAYGVTSALSDADIFIDCSPSDATGLTAIEAMAAGVAVVGPIDWGLTEFVRHGHNGLLVNKHDESAVLSAVSQLVADRTLLERIQANALEVLVLSPVVSAFRILDCLFSPTHQELEGCGLHSGDHS
ncbi:MAG: glycosyltransferase [Gammaproteobacteria bacterium]